MAPFASHRPARRSTRAFSLLEVLMAVALFGAIVTTILSAQAGLAAGNKAASNMSQALELGRCKMSEIEERELKLGFPEIEEKDTSVACCDDKDIPGFSCDWQVDRVTLPQANPDALGGDAGIASLGGALGLSGGAAPTGSELPTSLPGALGTAIVNPAGGAQLDLDGGLQNMGQSLQQQSFGGASSQGLLSMVFGLVYPSLKPLLEAAIRRVAVVVRWKEGAVARDFTVVQYVTNPSRAGLLSAMIPEGGVPASGVSPTAAPAGAR